MTIAIVAFQLVGAHQSQRTLPGFFVVEIHVVGIGRDGEHIDAETDGHHGGCAILVNHRLDSAQAAVFANDRNSSTTASNHQHTVVHQIPDHLELDDEIGRAHV